MKPRLFIKFFLLFLTTSVTAVIVMGSIMQFLVYRNFTDYVDQMELDTLDGVVYALAEEYQTHNGWEIFRNDERRWHELLRTYLPERESPHRPPPRLQESDFHYNDRVRRNSESENRRYRTDDDNRRRDYSETERRSRRPPPPHHSPPMSSIGRRLSLFDAEKRIVVGNPVLQGQSIRVIEVNGQTVGWLGIKRQDQLTHPTDMAFLKRQSQAFYVIGGIVLLLAIIVSLLFSRHLESPIRQLTEGTRNLRNRRFDTRITVSTSDELGQLATDFNTMAQTLENYENTRRQWLSDIAHELRTPLAVLRGEIEALQDGIRKISPKTIDSLHAEVLHLSNIVNDLHQISRIESGMLEMKKAPVNPVEVLRNTLDCFESRFNQKQMEINANLETSEQIIIIGDAVRLTQVFSNIFENILSYADSPGIVTANIHYRKDQVDINIEDSGPGVPHEALSHLFDRLYRADFSRTRTNGGSGLGLSICKSIIEAHQGQISAGTAPSGGLRIIIQLPLHHACELEFSLPISD